MFRIFFMMMFVGFCQGLYDGISHEMARMDEEEDPFYAEEEEGAWD